MQKARRSWRGGENRPASLGMTILVVGRGSNQYQQGNRKSTAKNGCATKKKNGSKDPPLHRGFDPGEVDGAGGNTRAGGDGDGTEFFDEAEFYGVGVVGEQAFAVFVVERIINVRAQIEF